MHSANVVTRAIKIVAGLWQRNASPHFLGVGCGWTLGVTILLNAQHGHGGVKYVGD
jgi:hypothetical protein